ncbi:MAG: pilin [Planctomycetota bacterium]|jgi:prepilin-type N-terminal cleavage/methylation domain-containing protein
MRNKRGFTLVELMVVILIVGILAAVAIPLMQGRIDKAKWSEANATAGTIRTAVRAYAAETSIGRAQQDLQGQNMADSTTLGRLGFVATDLEGTYFTGANYTIATVSANGIASVEVTGGSLPDSPTGTYILQENGDWVKQTP